MKKLMSVIFTVIFLLASTNIYAKVDDPKTKKWRLFGKDKYELTSSSGCTVTTYERTFFLGVRTSVRATNVEYIC